MSEAPAELWLRVTEVGRWYQSRLEPPEPDAVRYVRADLYDAVVRRAQQIVDLYELRPQQEPLGELGKASCLEPLETIKERQRLQR